MHELAFELNIRGHNVWVDETHQMLGDALWPPIEEAIQRSRVFLLVASEASLSSPFVRKEIGCALNSPGAPRVISVLVGAVAGSDLPQELRSIVYATSDTSAAVDASRISAAIGEPAPEVSPSLWLRVDRERLGHALATLPSAAEEPGPVILLNGDYKNLVAEILERADATRSWLAGHPGVAEDWLVWIERLPVRVRNTTRLISDLLGRYLKYRTDESSEGRFQQAMSLTAVRHFAVCLDRALVTVTYLGQPSDENRDAAVVVLKPIAGPNPDGIVVDVVWGSVVVKARCPSYIERIDLPPGLAPASRVVMAHDLGAMVGDALAARIWPRAGETPLEIGIPTLADVEIGPA